MRRALFLSLTAVLAAGGCAGRTKSAASARALGGPHVAVGTELKEQDLAATLRATGGKWIVAAIYAPMCGGCIEEAVVLAGKKAAWEKQGVALIGLGYAETAEDCREFLESTGGRANFPLYRARWALEKYKIGATPGLLLFDSGGKLLFKVDAEKSDHPAADLERKLEKLIGGN